MELKEKDIVNHICDNFNEYFPELYGCRKEYIIRDSRVDIFSSCRVDLYEMGIRSLEEHPNLNRYVNAAVFIEVKYKDNDRDLMYEIQKHIAFRDWYVNVANCYCYIVVISDSYDEYMLDFLIANDIVLLKYDIENEDLNTLKLEEYGVLQAV